MTPFDSLGVVYCNHYTISRGFCPDLAVQTGPISFAPLCQHHFERELRSSGNRIPLSPDRPGRSLRRGPHPLQP